jgi:hypothetical protein
MHFVEVGAWQGLKPAVHPKHLRGAEAPLLHGKAVLVAFCRGRDASYPVAPPHRSVPVYPGALSNLL